MTMRWPARGAAFAFAAWSLGVGFAAARSGLPRTEPAPNSRVGRPPGEVKVCFGERLERTCGAVRVIDARGAGVDREDAHVDPADPLVLRASLKTRDRGALVAEGHFAFQVV